MDLLVPCIVEGRSELRNAGRVNCKTHCPFRAAEHLTYWTNKSLCSRPFWTLQCAWLSVRCYLQISHLKYDALSQITAFLPCQAFFIYINLSRVSLFLVFFFFLIKKIKLFFVLAMWHRFYIKSRNEFLYIFEEKKEETFYLFLLKDSFFLFFFKFSFYSLLFRALLRTFIVSFCVFAFTFFVF